MHLEVDVNTFRGNLKLAALDDLDGLNRLIARCGLGVLDLLDNLVALEDFTEDDVAAIEPTGCHLLEQISMIRDEGISRGDDSGDEELGSIGVGAGVGHGELALLGVLELEVLILELVAVD